MAGRLPSPGPIALLRFALHLRGFARVFARLIRDRRVPKWAKLIPLAMLVWFISPLDLDWIPVTGWLDDLAILILGLRLFVRCCPEDVVAEHVAAVGGNAMRGL